MIYKKGVVKIEEETIKIEDEYDPRDYSGLIDE